MGTIFDDYQNQSIEKAYNVVEDPEKVEREEYLKKLMCFRKDELVPNEDASSSSEQDEEEVEKKQNVIGVENALQLVEKIDDKMQTISQVVRGIDKRMSYNLRLISAVLGQDMV